MIQLKGSCFPVIRFIQSFPSSRGAQFPFLQCNYSSKSASSQRWLQRQKSDRYSSQASVEGLRSRAAYKLQQIDKKYNLFKQGMTVVDLGFAPGSWSQVAVEKTHPQGRVIGVDILPCRPPKGASSIQGNFLSKSVQDELKKMLSTPDAGRPKQKQEMQNESYIESEMEHLAESPSLPQKTEPSVDIVLSDMCEPWPPTTGVWLRTINSPYIRLMNTSGIALRDHTVSIVSKC